MFRGPKSYSFDLPGGKNRVKWLLSLIGLGSDYIYRGFYCD